MTMAALAILAAVAIVSCKGRTLDNVEPTGETIEVFIDTAATDTVM